MPCAPTWPLERCTLLCFLQGAIDTKKQEQESDQYALNQLMEDGMDTGVHPLERPGVPAHIKVGTEGGRDSDSTRMST